MAPLRVLILSDGRPGHFHLSEGIAAAIERLRPIELSRIGVRRRGWPGRVLAGLVNAGMPPATVLRVVYGVDDRRLPDCDLIVSAGAETLAANISLSRLRQVPNVFYGSLRAFKPHDFALVLTSYARNAGLPRHAMALKPSVLGADALTRRPREFTGPGRPPRTAALLIGGNSGGFKYGQDDWNRLFAFLAASRRRHETIWIVCNSRRTPAQVSNEIAARARLSGNGIGAFIDVRRPDSATLARVFAEVEAVVCTADSSTMVSEAINARLPVLGATPKRHQFNANERGYRDHLAQNGWYAPLAIAELTPERFVAELGAIRPLTESPLDRLAVLLRERLPALFNALPPGPGPAMSVERPRNTRA